jgi:hypothetical protein
VREEGDNARAPRRGVGERVVVAGWDGVVYVERDGKARVHAPWGG